MALVGGRVPTEASGGVTLETIRAKAETGVTYVSVGRITQSAPAADIGLDFSAVESSFRWAREAWSLLPMLRMGRISQRRATTSPSIITRLGMMLVEPALDDPQVAGVRLEEEVGDGADPGNGSEQEIDADIAGHPREMPFRHSQIARLPGEPAAHRRGDQASADRDQVEDDVEAELAVGARAV